MTYYSIRNNSRIYVCDLTGSEDVSTRNTWCMAPNYAVNQNCSKLCCKWKLFQIMMFQQNNRSIKTVPNYVVNLTYCPYNLWLLASIISTIFYNQINILSLSLHFPPIGGVLTVHYYTLLYITVHFI